MLLEVKERLLQGHKRQHRQSNINVRFRHRLRLDVEGQQSVRDNQTAQMGEGLGSDSSIERKSPAPDTISTTRTKAPTTRSDPAHQRERCTTCYTRNHGDKERRNRRPRIEDVERETSTLTRTYDSGLCTTSDERRSLSGSTEKCLGI